MSPERGTVLSIVLIMCVMEYIAASFMSLYPRWGRAEGVKIEMYATIFTYTYIKHHNNK